MDPVESRVADAEVSSVNYRYLEHEVRRPNHYHRVNKTVPSLLCATTHDSRSLRFITI